MSREISHNLEGCSDSHIIVTIVDGQAYAYISGEVNAGDIANTTACTFLPTADLEARKACASMLGNSVHDGAILELPESCTYGIDIPSFSQVIVENKPQQGDHFNFLYCIPIAAVIFFLAWLHDVRSRKKKSRKSASQQRQSSLESERGSAPSTPPSQENISPPKTTPTPSNSPPKVLPPRPTTKVVADLLTGEKRTVGVNVELIMSSKDGSTRTVSSGYVDPPLPGPLFPENVRTMIKIMQDALGSDRVHVE